MNPNSARRPLDEFRRRKTIRSRQSRLRYHRLENRNLLAGIFFDSPTGFVTVAGDGLANTGQFSQLNDTTLRATLDGTTSMDFDAADVSKIIFIGFGGDDQFENLTSVEGLLLGNDGNDILIGGTGIDRINGGAGNDQLSGLEGSDRIIAGPGNDTIHGGANSDTLFGISGTNSIFGDAGDDIVFGGIEIDTIDGGEGIDQIFAGAGNDILFSGNGGVAGSPGVSQADLILGLDGDDTFTGDAGLNVFWGGNGNDTMVGGAGENRMHGQNGTDHLTGGPSADYLAGNNGDDVINGLSGPDFILPGFGNDTVNGGAGNDVVVFTSQFSDYQISGSSDPLTVTDLRGVEGTDSISQTATLRFVNGDHPTAGGITHRVQVQPIVLSNDNGSNSAEFFGNDSQEAETQQLIDDIFGQAGIDIQWLAERQWNNTFANVGDGGERPDWDLDTILYQGESDGVAHSNPRVINMYFVEIAAGYGDTGENQVNGLAFVDFNGITIHVGDRLVARSSLRRIVAEVAAHEIAHNLGLDHVSVPNNLMFDGWQLDRNQIFTMRNSYFSVSV